MPLHIAFLLLSWAAASFGSAENCIRNTSSYLPTKIFYDEIDFHHEPFLAINAEVEVFPGEKRCLALDLASAAVFQRKQFHFRYLNSKHRFLQLHLKDFWQEYLVTKHYNFTIPKLTTSCQCHCNSFSSNCNKDIETNCHLTSGKPGSYCVQKYSSGHKCYDGSQDKASVCCKIVFEKSEEYRALFFESPIAYYRFELSLLNSEGKVLLENEVTVDTTSHRFSLDDLGAFYVDDYPILQSLNPEWTFIDPKRPDDLIVNEPINEVKEGNLHKLGWYRTDGPRARPKGIQDQIGIHVRDCRNNDVQISYPHYGWNVNDIDFRTLLEKHESTAAKIEVTAGGMNVRVKTIAESRVKGRIGLKLPLYYMINFEESDFEGFTTKIVDDLVEVDIENAYGEITIEISNKTLMNMTFGNVNDTDYEEPCEFSREQSEEAQNCTVIKKQTEIVLIQAMQKKDHSVNIKLAGEMLGQKIVCLSTLGNPPSCRLLHEDRMAHEVKTDNVTNIPEVLPSYSFMQEQVIKDERLCEIMIMIVVFIALSVLVMGVSLLLYFKRKFKELRCRCNESNHFSSLPSKHVDV